MTRVKNVAAILVLSALGASSAVAADQAPAAVDPSRPNVAITLTVAKSGATAGDRTYRLVGQDGSRATMLMGWRMPIPTSSRPAEGAAASVNYVYQNVGVDADIAIRIVGPGRVLLDGTIEVSGAREGKPRADGEPLPIVGTFNQRLTIIATENKKIRVAEAPDPDGGTLRLELEVDVLD